MVNKQQWNSSSMMKCSMIFVFNEKKSEETHRKFSLKSRNNHRDSWQNFNDWWEKRNSLTINEWWIFHREKTFSLFSLIYISFKFNFEKYLWWKWEKIGVFNQSSFSSLTIHLCREKKTIRQMIFSVTSIVLLNLWWRIEQNDLSRFDEITRKRQK